jgi:Cu-processing system ATP-binding protein
VGPNGSGKTTLMKCILGLTRVTTGTITVGGVDVSKDDSYRARLGYMPQIARFPENLDAREVIDMIREVRGASSDRAEELIETFELGPQLNKPIRALSGGTRQKVSVVTSLMFSPDVLILDEPTAGLDPVISSRLKDVIAAERARGTCILLTSHIMSEIEELADTMVFLLDGSVVFHRPVSEITASADGRNLERAVADLMQRTRGAA